MSTEEYLVPELPPAAAFNVLTAEDQLLAHLYTPFDAICIPSRSSFRSSRGAVREMHRHRCDEPAVHCVQLSPSRAHTIFARGIAILARGLVAHSRHTCQFKLPQVTLWSPKSASIRLRRVRPKTVGLPSRKIKEYGTIYVCTMSRYCW